MVVSICVDVNVRVPSQLTCVDRVRVICAGASTSRAQRNLRQPFDPAGPRPPMMKLWLKRRASSPNLEGRLNGILELSTFS